MCAMRYGAVVESYKPNNNNNENISNNGKMWTTKTKFKSGTMNKILVLSSYEPLQLIFYLIF